jgi:hypothetical protein
MGNVCSNKNKQSKSETNKYEFDGNNINKLNQPINIVIYYHVNDLFNDFNIFKSKFNKVIQEQIFFKLIDDINTILTNNTNILYKYNNFIEVFDYDNIIKELNNVIKEYDKKRPIFPYKDDLLNIILKLEFTSNYIKINS